VQQEAAKTSIEKWDDLHRQVQWGTCPEPAVARWAMRRWGGRDKDARGSVHLLEVGCGVGAMAFWLASNGFLVRAIDASSSAIQRAEHLYGNILPHSLQFFTEDVEMLPRGALSAGYYDGVVDVCCLQHVEDLAKAIGAVWKMLKRGGQLLSIIACADHSLVMREELKGATFHRLTQGDVYATFVMFLGIKLESMTHTDNGANISHWIIEATK